jgi:hypothetical protein
MKHILTFDIKIYEDQVVGVLFVNSERYSCLIRNRGVFSGKKIITSVQFQLVRNWKLDREIAGLNRHCEVIKWQLKKQ